MLLATAAVSGQSEAEERPFRMLVVGDSHVWGQGLEEKDKFYTHTAEWLRREAFGKPRVVDLKVKAHSGATIRFDPKQEEQLRRAGRDESQGYTGEMNVAFPSMWKQLEIADAEYRAAGAAAGADLIMITACITDITVEGVLDPRQDPAKLPPMIREVCGDKVRELVRHAAELNPNALIAVVGYFPIISEHSSSSRIFNGYLVSKNIPRAIRWMVNNALVRKLAFGKLRRRAIERSKIWFDESNRSLQAAVDAANAGLSEPRAVFIRSPFTEENAAEAPRTLLFRMRKSGKVEDPLFERRKADCRIHLTELKRSTGIDVNPGRCSIAAVGHPDPAGARAYADAIIDALRGRIPGK